MWNRGEYAEVDYYNDELERFPAGAGFPDKSSADWGWVQHMHASLNATGRAAVVLDTGAASRGSGNAGTKKERTVRQWFVDEDLIESVLYLPENIFYEPALDTGVGDARTRARWSNALAWILIDNDRNIAKGVGHTERSVKLDPEQVWDLSRNTGVRLHQTAAIRRSPCAHEGSGRQASLRASKPSRSRNKGQTTA